MKKFYKDYSIFFSENGELVLVLRDRFLLSRKTEEELLEEAKKHYEKRALKNFANFELECL